MDATEAFCGSGSDSLFARDIWNRIPATRENRDSKFQTPTPADNTTFEGPKSVAGIGKNSEGLGDRLGKDQKTSGRALSIRL